MLFYYLLVQAFQNRAIYRDTLQVPDFHFEEKNTQNEHITAYFE